MKWALPNMKMRQYLLNGKTYRRSQEAKSWLACMNLAALLSTTKHPDSRSLRCKGVILDTGAASIAFVYEVPFTGLNQPSVMTSSDSFQPPQSLRSLFSASVPASQIASRLALQITNSVKYFHTAGWLHKDRRSENILLLISEGSKLLPTSL